MNAKCGRHDTEVGSKLGRSGIEVNSEWGRCACGVKLKLIHSDSGVISEGCQSEVETRSKWLLNLSRTEIARNFIWSGREIYATLKRVRGYVQVNRHDLDAKWNLKWKWRGKKCDTSASTKFMQATSKCARRRD